MTITKNYAGQVFARLKTIKFHHTNKYGHSFYVFGCECGNRCVKRINNVRIGRTRSCGCLPRKSKPAGETAFNKLFYMYRVGAEARKLTFNLSKKHFRELTKCPCTYCGSVPSKQAFQYWGEGRSTPYVYNGIDRVVNTKGYTHSNTVTCCTTCNYAKRSMSLAEFMAWIDRLVKFRTQNIESPVIDRGMR